MNPLQVIRIRQSILEQPLMQRNYEPNACLIAVKTCKSAVEIKSSRLCPTLDHLVEKIEKEDQNPRHPFGVSSGIKLTT